MTWSRRFLCFCCVVVASLSGGCQVAWETSVAEAGVRTPEPSLPEVDVATLRPQVAAFCGNCHATPPASSFPKSAWRLEVDRGFDFYFESARHDLHAPPQEAVVAFFESQAPDELHVAAPAPAAAAPSRTFRPTEATAPSELEPPAVSFLTWHRLREGEPPSLLFCDMRSGELRAAAPTAAAELPTRLLASCAHPAHIEPCDLDGDGQREFVIAELGSARSGDHARGAVIWLRPRGAGWEQRLLLSGVGRVADVQPADLDGDGDVDLLVAEFGHFHTGSIRWLEQLGLKNGVPQFREHLIDDRHGTIHVPTADLNGDGRLDFVALISQEYEVVEAFLNQGDGTFQRETIFRGEDPAYGSSGIQLVDLDGDGDLDVLYSNGDTFGSEHLKPYHGIHWLENRGTYPFEDHWLTGMVGVQKALAGDLDGDGDMDIAAVALMPKNLLASPELQQHDSVLWLEQVAKGEFVRHGLERNQFHHAGLELADLDGDGDLDLAVGNMLPDDAAPQPWMSVWRNQAASEGAARPGNNSTK